MSTTSAVAVAAIFTWLGMVAAISFIEAPLKFRAPGVTLQIGLGIGRLVFRALNIAEAILAVAIVVAFDLRLGPDVVGRRGRRRRRRSGRATPRGAPAAHPTLGCRAGHPEPLAPTGTGKRSRIHYAYVALELVKVVALLAAGISLLGA